MLDMQTWLSEALIFLGGVATGILLATIWLRASAANKRRRDLSTVRRRILAGIKQTHDQEILNEAFRATEALRSELFKSLYRLRASMNVVQRPDLHEEEQKKADAQAPESAGTEPH
jgi:hypothetical protein